MMDKAKETCKLRQDLREAAVITEVNKIKTIISGSFFTHTFAKIYFSRVCSQSSPRTRSIG